MNEIPLYELAHGRTGDKGNRINISLVAYRAEDYALLAEQVTCERVAAHFAHRKPAGVQRYLLPNLGAINFVLDEVLDGGVNDSLNLDAHGKTLSFHLLDMAIPVPAGRAARGN
ncbi:MAG: AtuA-related protein [Ramlibacter sp.]